MGLLDRARKVVKRIKWLTVELAYETDEERSCSRKVRHKSGEVAAAVARGMEKKLGREMEAYPCDYCDGWHVGGRSW